MELVFKAWSFGEDDDGGSGWSVFKLKLGMDLCSWGREESFKHTWRVPRDVLAKSPCEMEDGRRVWCQRTVGIAAGWGLVAIKFLTS